VEGDTSPCDWLFDRQPVAYTLAGEASRRAARRPLGSPFTAGSRRLRRSPALPSAERGRVLGSTGYTAASPAETSGRPTDPVPAEAGRTGLRETAPNTTLERTPHQCSQPTCRGARRWWRRRGGVAVAPLSSADSALRGCRSEAPSETAPRAGIGLLGHVVAPMKRLPEMGRASPGWLSTLPPHRRQTAAVRFRRSGRLGASPGHPVASPRWWSTAGATAGITPRGMPRLSRSPLSELGGAQPGPLHEISQAARPFSRQRCNTDQRTGPMDTR
jgi:hypothetical protein